MKKTSLPSLVAPMLRAIMRSRGLHPMARGVLPALLWTGALCLGSNTRARAADAQTFYQAPGTKQMSEFLQEWKRVLGARNPYAGAEQIKSLQAQIAQTTNANQRLSLMLKLAVQQINAGYPEHSLLTITNLRAAAVAARTTLNARDRRELALREGVAYLRLGELENCWQHHNPDSCLIPIRGGGQHTERRGAQNAESIFLELARSNTNDLGPRWLLNIAAMTLGHYPDGVPKDLLIPPVVFDSEYPLPKFPEIAAKVGLALDDIAGGTITEDFDGDGLLDVILSCWNPTGQLRYFKNLGNGHFEDRTAEAGLTGVTGGLNLIQADYNNDGWPDFYIVRGAWLGELGRLPDSLLKNNGDGTFADVTEAAGLLAFHPALSAVWFDANNDGWLDLFVGNETTTGSTNLHPCQLFLNNRNGTFTECAAAAGAAIIGFVRGVSAGDFDNDGWPDLYLSRFGEPNLLLHNEGRDGTNAPPGVHFADATARAKVAEPLYSFPTWFWDYDNDGWLDLFVCGYFSSFQNEELGEYVADKLGLPSAVDKPRLYRNHHDGTFSDVTRAAHLDHVLVAMGANFGDLDNDGFLDFYLGTGAPSFASLMPNEMFRNDRGQRFQNVTTTGGFGHLQKGHAVAFADLNNDGQQDVLINMGGSYTGDNYFDALFANPGNRNHWLCLKLLGHQSNRSAMGARIKVVASAKGKAREIHRVVASGGSFGASPLRQEIGLGDANQIERIEIWWPTTGKTNTLANLELDRFYEVDEGSASARLLSPRSFTWELQVSPARMAR